MTELVWLSCRLGLAHDEDLDEWMPAVIHWEGLDDGPWRLDSAAERLCYWCGAALMWIALPITLPTTLYLARRIRKRGLQRS